MSIFHWHSHPTLKQNMITNNSLRFVLESLQWVFMTLPKSFWKDKMFSSRSASGIYKQNWCAGLRGSCSFSTGMLQYIMLHKPHKKEPKKVSCCNYKNYTNDIFQELRYDRFAKIEVCNSVSALQTYLDVCVWIFVRLINVLRKSQNM